MRHTIQQQALKTHFAPNTGVGGATPSAVRPAVALPRAKRRSFARIAFRTASKVFWAVAGEKAFTRAMSQHGVPGALLSGSLAAGTAYVQERAARRPAAVSPHAMSQRSLFSLYTVIGMGVGLGAMLVNRRR